MTQQTLVGQGHHIIVALRSHSDTSHALRLLWTRNRPVAEISTWTDTTLKKRQVSLLQEGFEPAVSKSKRSHTHALDGASTEIG